MSMSNLHSKLLVPSFKVVVRSVEVAWSLVQNIPWLRRETCTPSNGKSLHPWVLEKYARKSSRPSSRGISPQRKVNAAEHIPFVSASIKSASWLCGIAGVSVRLKPLVQDSSFFTHLQDCDPSFLSFPSFEYRNPRWTAFLLLVQFFLWLKLQLQINRTCWSKRMIMN